VRDRNGKVEKERLRGTKENVQKKKVRAREKNKEKKCQIDWNIVGCKNRKSIETNRLNLHIWLREIKKEREKKNMTSEIETERQRDKTGEAVRKKL